MPGERKTKAVAKRIDPSYPKYPSPMRSLRRLLVIVCAVLAVAWAGWALLARSENLYNPGPVAPAHAMFENNCAACHVGSGSKFLKTVTDSACLKCHDAAIHADKQISLVTMTDGKPARSSNCTTCHVEHKGHAALAGAGDALCTRCHDNLTANVAGGRTPLPSSVKAFDAPPAHPTFGRVLRQGGQGGDKWNDPTPLKFNHKKHLTEITPAVGDCTTCHQISSSGARRVMQPVSFDSNCKSCHSLSLGNNLVEVPHQSMDFVRLFAVAGLPAAFTQKLASMSPEEKDKALTVTYEEKVGIRKVTKTKKITDAEWLAAQIPAVDAKVAGSAVADLPAYKNIQAADPAVKNAAALELYIAYVMTDSCSKCHEFPADAQEKFPMRPLQTLATGYFPSHATTPTTAPTTRPLPTNEGRRWLAASVFKHDSHRSLSCIECHGQAKISTLTADVLLPDAQSCITCHHPPSRNNLTASNNCTTCHSYHERGKEIQPIKGLTVEELLGRPKTLAAK